MVEIEYAPEFIRTWKKLPTDLQNEVIDKIELFKKRENHPFLKVHKLKGGKKDQWSFSVNFHYRIVFMYDKRNKNRAQLLDVGDHTIYD